MWDLVGNPEDRFSQNEAQIIIHHANMPTKIRPQWYALTPHIYIVKLEVTQVYIVVFLIFYLNIDFAFISELPLLGGSIEYPQTIF